MEAQRHRRLQQRGWDRAVEHYETYWRRQLRPAHEAVLAAADLHPGEHVLDVACGTGMVTLPAAQRVGPSGRVVATDISRRMIECTAKRAAEAGLTNIDVHRADGEHLGLNERFDAALCSLGLMYVPAPAVALTQMAESLRPGGRVVAAVWGERRRCGWATLFPIVDARVASDVCPLFFGLGAPGALAAAATTAGLIDIAEQRLATELVYDDAESALGAAFLGGPVALAYAHFDDATKTSAHAEYLDSIEPFRDGAGYRVPGEFVVVGGRTPS